MVKLAVIHYVRQEGTIMPRKKVDLATMTEEEQIKYHAYRFFLQYNNLKHREGRSVWNDLPEEKRDAYLQLARLDMEDHKRMEM